MNWWCIGVNWHQIPILFNANPLTDFDSVLIHFRALDPTSYNPFISHSGHFKDFKMLTLTSVEAQSRFGELIDRSQREPVQVTRRGRPVAYVICNQDMQVLSDLRTRREAASRWYAQYREQLALQAGVAAEAAALTDADVTRLVNELR